VGAAGNSTKEGSPWLLLLWFAREQRVGIVGLRGNVLVALPQIPDDVIDRR
jgi:hypothetical protein